MKTKKISKKTIQSVPYIGDRTPKMTTMCINDNRERLYRYDYMMLSRLNDDASAYFGRSGNADDDKWDCRYQNARMIWGESIEALIAEMERLWQKLPADLKPKWLSLERITEYKTRL